MRLFKLFSLVAIACGLSAQSPPNRYAVGQVWEYHTRPGDEGSLLKIQRVENDPMFAKSGPVFHISVIGFHFSNPRMTPVLPNAPVTRQTLNESVTALSTSAAVFPSAEPGIAEWKNAKGGVFTISVAQIVDVIDKQTAHAGD